MGNQVNFIIWLALAAQTCVHFLKIRIIRFFKCWPTVVIWLRILLSRLPVEGTNLLPQYILQMLSFQSICWYRPSSFARLCDVSLNWMIAFLLSFSVILFIYLSQQNSCYSVQTFLVC